MKVLVVEDHVDMLHLVEKALLKEQFVVDTAMDGDIGFKKALKNIYDLILLDLRLPHKSGFEIISQLRARNINTPILVISGKTRVEDRVMGLEIGADDYLVKNFSVEELIARVKTLLRRNMRIRRNILKVNDIIVNLSDMSVTHNGCDVKLSKKELSILIVLMKNKDKVVSREEIIESGWSESDPRVSSNTVDVHIKSLRNKLLNKQGTKTKIIETIRGYGYIIREK